mmetsp:Transcript_25278/g.50326  ORF Transcript_25278/g.50326 Transcript_25278/m.50326 type:complete len:240 (+) Transcript_25278:1499-2218(+)
MVCRTCVNGTAGGSGRSESSAPIWTRSFRGARQASSWRGQTTGAGFRRRRSGLARRRQPVRLERRRTRRPQKVDNHTHPPPTAETRAEGMAGRRRCPQTSRGRDAASVGGTSTCSSMTRRESGCTGTAGRSRWRAPARTRTSWCTGRAATDWARRGSSGRNSCCRGDLDGAPCSSVAPVVSPGALWGRRSHFRKASPLACAKSVMRLTSEASCGWSHSRLRKKHLIFLFPEEPSCSFNI